MFVQYVCSKQSDKTMLQVIDFIDIYITAINSAISSIIQFKQSTHNRLRLINRHKYLSVQLFVTEYYHALV